MIKAINRATLFFTLFYLFLVTGAHAQSSPSCVNPEVSIGYFNGVRTTFASARADRAELRLALSSSFPDVKREYILFYNRTSSGSGDLGWKDILETFDQRLREQRASVRLRYELFWDALHGGGNISNQLVSIDPSIGQMLNLFSETLRQANVNAITGARSNNITFDDYRQHRNLLDQIISENRRIVLIAHSQGNLFANRAFSYAQGRTNARSLRMIHVAPASTILNGPYILADNDLVINVGLRAIGGVPPANVSIPAYSQRAPGPNGRRDSSGHGFIEIYLNKSLVPLTNIRSHFSSHLMDMGANQACIVLRYEGPFPGLTSAIRSGNIGQDSGPVTAMFVFNGVSRSFSGELTERDLSDFVVGTNRSLRGDNLNDITPRKLASCVNPCQIIRRLRIRMENGRVVSHFFEFGYRYSTSLARGTYPDDVATPYVNISSSSTIRSSTTLSYYNLGGIRDVAIYDNSDWFIRLTPITTTLGAYYSGATRSPGGEFKIVN